MAKDTNMYSRIFPRGLVRAVPSAETTEKLEPLVDENTLTALIANNEDPGPLIRNAFEAGKPEALLLQLRNFGRKREAEIEELCKVHYEEFILAVEHLRLVLLDADELKGEIEVQNNDMQEVGTSLLVRLEELIESFGIKNNLGVALTHLHSCRTVLDLCAKVNLFINEDKYYQALKALDTLERDHLSSIPAKSLKTYVEKQIPTCRTYIERKVNKEFTDWLIQIRSVSRDIGKEAIAQAKSTHQREIELEESQRQAEELSKSGQSTVYILELEEGDDDSSFFKIDLTPVYRAHYINACLGLETQFKENYFKNRELQLNTDIQFTPGQFAPQSFNLYCALVAGFFIVEDRVMRTSGGIISPENIETLWEFAVSKVKSVMEEQFARLNTADHMLLIKEDVSLLCASLRRFGFPVSSLLDVLDASRDKYHDLLLADSRRHITDALLSDNFEQLMIRKEHDYSTNVLAFHIQSSDIMPAFPYVAPFSSSIPECCKIVKSFVDSSVSFLRHSGYTDLFDLVRKYLDRLLTSVLNDSMLRHIRQPNLDVSKAMQIAANVNVLERACNFFAEHAAKLSGVPIRIVESPHGGLSSRAVLRNSHSIALDTLVSIVKTQINEMINSRDVLSWCPSDIPKSESYNISELSLHLKAILETAKHLLPLETLEKLSSSFMRHVNDQLVNCLCGDVVKKFNLYGIQGLDIDLRMLETFADAQFEKFGLSKLPSSVPLKSHLTEIRQMVNLLLSNQPELFSNKSTKDKNYYAIDPSKVLILTEKYRDVDSRNLVFGSRNSNPHMNKKKSLDSLAKKIRDELLI